MHPADARPHVSILIPLLNEIRHLPALFDSIAHQTYPPQHVEVLVIDGGSSDGSREWIRQQESAAPFSLRLIDNPARLQAPGLSLGLAASRGEFIVRMDAHATYNPEYVATAINILRTRPAVINVGGPQVAAGTSLFGRGAALAMNSPLGVGGAEFRYLREERPVDTVFLGAWRRAELVAAGGWNPAWEVNEDGELNIRLGHQPGRIILLTPLMQVFYHPRDSLRALFRQYFRYGCWRMKTFRHYPEAMRVSHLAPLILTPALALSTVLGLFPAMHGLWLVPAAYLSGVGISGWILARRAGTPELGGVTSVCLATMQVAWGAGALSGMRRFGIPVTAIGRAVARGFRSQPS